MCYDLLEIAKFAQGVRSIFWGKSSPVLMEDVVADLGGVIEDIDPEKVNDSDLKGDYACITNSNNDNYKFKIKIVNDIDKKLRNFILCHEIGHLFLHFNYSNDFSLPAHARKAYAKNKYGFSEDEANTFAMNFLMPEKEYEEALNKYYNDQLESYDVEEISNYFSVPVPKVITVGKERNMLYPK